MERRFISATAAPVKLSKRADGDGKDITGYGAVYYDGTEATEYLLWEYSDMRCIERIMAGCFNRAIAESQDVRGLFNHDPNQILGRTAAGTMTLVSDKRGLKYDIDPGNTTVAKDVMEHLARGDVTGSSFSFDIKKQTTTEIEENGRTTIIRQIEDVNLYDCGPVTFPAYVGTEAGLRSMGESDPKTQYEAATAQRKGEAEKKTALAAKIAGYRERAKLVS